MNNRLCIAVVLMALAACGADSGSKPVAQRSMQITVSGLSSGGYMAGQLHLAHSDRISGAGILAAGPYRCSQGNLMRALGTCVSGDGLVPADSADAARSAADNGDIAAIANLADDRVWVFHGRNDTVVGAQVSATVVDTYRLLGTQEAAIEYIDSIPAAHGFPTLAAGVPCDQMAAPFVNACDYDAAGALLSFLTQRTASPEAEAQGSLDTFAQQAPVAAGMDEAGFIYRPEQCATEQCDLHIVLHGCGQGASYVSDAVARTAGYNRWADALDLVVLYPQVSPDLTKNPLGCWDWWGYTDAAFATRDAPQIVVLNALIDRFQKGEL